MYVDQKVQIMGIEFPPTLVLVPQIPQVTSIKIVMFLITQQPMLKMSSWGNFPTIEWLETLL